MYSLGVHQLIREAHDLENERIAKDFDSGEMLCLADDDLADSDCACRANCFAQQRVGFFGAFAGHEIVGSLEVARIDFLFLHEIEDVDGLRSFDRRGLEVFVAS